MPDLFDPADRGGGGLRASVLAVQAGAYLS